MMPIWSKVMTSKVEQKAKVASQLVTASTGVNGLNLRLHQFNHKLPPKAPKIGQKSVEKVRPIMIVSNRVLQLAAVFITDICCDS